MQELVVDVNADLNSMEDWALPTKWQTIKLEDVGKFINGYAFKPTDWGTAGSPIIRIQNLNDSTKPFNYFAGELDSRYKVVDGDILISWSASLGAYLWRGPDAWLNQHIFKVVLDDNAIDHDFFYWVMRRQIERVAEHAHGSTMQHVTQKVFLATEIPLPPRLEQRAIAHVLHTIQDATQARRRELELERERKAALMQHLFTYGTRGEPTKQTEIGEMPESWQVVQLGQVLSVLLDHRGQTPKKLGGDFTTSGVRVISAMNIKDGRLMLDRNVRYVSYEMYNRWMPEKLRINDVLLTSEAPLGAVALLEQDAAYCLSQRLFALRANSFILDAHFLFHALRSEGMQSRLQARASGTTAFGIRQSELVRVPLEMPPLAEQRAVAEALTACDGKMSAMGEEIAFLEELFGALLEELMTGRLSTQPLIEVEDEAAV